MWPQHWLVVFKPSRESGAPRLTDSTQDLHWHLFWLQSLKNPPDIVYSIKLIAGQNSSVSRWKKWDIQIQQRKIKCIVSCAVALQFKPMNVMYVQ